ncbi:MAG: ABC transporter permease [Acetobacteraceae bacterium]|nr:ABC transporter permease [Acetobacteraceae bacterium]
MRLTGSLARWESLLLLFLFGAFVYGSFASPYFLTASNISIAIAGAMPGAIVALPMTLIIVTGEIDISVGSIVGLCATTLAVCLEHGLSIKVAMVLNFVVGILAGLFNGVVVAYGGLPSLVVTIGTLALYRGIAQIILEERGVSNFPDWYQSMGFGTVGVTPIPWSLVIFVAFFVGFAVFLHRTRWGRALYAIGNNREAARFSGINVKRAILGVFTTSGAMCSIAAIVLTAYLASARSDTATGLALPVITVVVLGGVDIFGGSGSMGGILLALFVLAFVQNALGLAGVAPEEQQIVSGAVLIVTLVVFGASGFIKRKVAAPRHFRSARQTAPERRVGFAEASNDDGR